MVGDICKYYFTLQNESRKLTLMCLSLQNHQMISKTADSIKTKSEMYLTIQTRSQALEFQP